MIEGKKKIPKTVMKINGAVKRGGAVGIEESKFRKNSLLLAYPYDKWQYQQC